MTKSLPLRAMCTVIVMLGTANHFVIDAVGGAVAPACGFVAAR